MTKMISRKVLPMLAVMGLAFALAGCGGSGSPADPVGNQPGGNGTGNGGGGGTDSGTPTWTPPGPGLWIYGAEAPVAHHTVVNNNTTINSAIIHANADTAGTRFVLAVGLTTPMILSG